MNTQDFPFHFRTIVSGDFFHDRRNEEKRRIIVVFDEFQ